MNQLRFGITVLDGQPQVISALSDLLIETVASGKNMGLKILIVKKTINLATRHPIAAYDNP